MFGPVWPDLAARPNPRPGAALSRPPLQRDPGEQDEAGVAIGAKEPQRRRGSAPSTLRNLPGEMRRVGEPADQRDCAAARDFDRHERERRAPP